MRNLEFHNLKEPDRDTCEHCAKTYKRTEEIEGVGPFTFHTSCDECCDFEKKLGTLNQMIGTTRRELDNIKDQQSENATKARKLLEIQRQKRNKVIHDAKRFFEERNSQGKPARSQSARVPYKE